MQKASEFDVKLMERIGVLKRHRCLTNAVISKELKVSRRTVERWLEPDTPISRNGKDGLMLLVLNCHLPLVALDLAHAMDEKGVDKDAVDFAMEFLAERITIR